MDAYDQLRKHARSQRDAIVRKAQADCRAALRKIDELERKVGNGAPPPPKGRIRKSVETLAVIRDALPQGRPFTVDEMRTVIQGLQPGRKVSSNSVTASLRRLALAGVVRRESRGYQGRVQWIAVAADECEEPFAALWLPDAAARVLRECGPLRELEIVLEIQRRGCRTDDPPRTVLRSLVKTLRDNPLRFTLGDDGRWAAI